MGDGAINFEETGEIGRKIQQTLDGVKMEEASIKRKDKVRNVEDLMPKTKIDGKDVHIDPTILFSRLTALVNFKEKFVDNFSYELTLKHRSLLKYRLIQKPKKATLRNNFATKEKAIVQIKSSTKLTISREAFLANAHNQVQPIKILSAKLQAVGFMTEQSKGNADTLIVKSTITYAQDRGSVIIMAEDTDILVLLMSHWREGMGDMLFRTDIKEKKK